MKGKRFTEEQIIRALKEAESGLKVSDLCRQQGISEATYYRWKSKYGGMEVSAAKRLILQLHLVDGRVDWSRDWQMPDTGSWFCTAGDGAKPISGALVGVSNR